MKILIVLELTLLLGIALPGRGAGQPKVETLTENNSSTDSFPSSRLPELYALIDEIKTQNPPHNYRIRIQTGLIQITTNTTDAIIATDLPALGIGVLGNLWGNLGVSGRMIYAQNLIPSPYSSNGSGAYTYWLDLGPRYTFYFDSTHVDDFLALQLLYHRNDSNFIMGNSTGTIDTTQLIYMTHYEGISGSIERSIPITRKLGVLASFDLLQIINATSPTQLAFNPSGYGFQIEGEIYYQIEIFSSPFRLGMSYWQQGNENEFDENTSKGTLGRNSYFQLARAITLNLSTRF